MCCVSLVCLTGCAYIAEFGQDFQGTNARISQMCYIAGTPTATCQISADPTSGSLPLTVTLSGAASSHSQGAALSYEWDFDGDGNIDATTVDTSHTFTTAGDKVVTLKVSDGVSAADQCTVNIAAGNNPPAVTILQPPLEGGIMDWEAQLVFQGKVEDVEDGQTPTSISCNDLVVSAEIGHEDHSHGISPDVNGCYMLSNIGTFEGNCVFM